MRTSRRQRSGAAVVILCALAATAAAQSARAPAAAARAEETSAPERLSAIEARLERIAAALEQQVELARLDLIVRRVESGERRLDELEGSLAQARSYDLALRERRASAATVLAETEERVATGWPPGPREEAVRRRDEAEATLGEIDAAIASQEASLADLAARAARLRQEIAAWSALLEAELGAAVPPLEEAAEGEETAAPAEGETPEAGAPEP
jgi:hypothetical protein